MIIQELVPFEDPAQYFKILYQNFQSIFNKQELVESFIDQDPIYQSICGTESWLTEEKLKLLKFNGYKFAASFCRKNRVGGGVCILLQEDIESEEIQEIADMSIEYVIEACALILKKENIMIVTVYWNRRKEVIFYEQLDKILNFIREKYYKFTVIIGGDFNTDMLQTTPKSTKLLNFMLEFKFKQYITEPTHSTPTSSTCLDLIFTNTNKSTLKTKVVDLGFSNHKGVTISHQLSQMTQKITWYATKRIYSERNIQLFKSRLKTIDWYALLDKNNDINEKYEKFHNTLKIILDECIPIKMIKLNNSPKKHWLTVGIKKSCLHKRLLKILIIQSNYNNILTNYYKKYVKILKKIVINSKKICNANKIKRSKNVIKTMWNIIKEHSNKKGKREKTNIELKTNNQIITDNTQVANIFNEFFASVGQNRSISSGGRPALNPPENSMFLYPVSNREVYNIIKSLKMKNSCGVDELPPSLFIQCAEELTLPFYIMINQSFNEGIFPDLMKISLIKPVHKKDSKLETTNYRPIALLPTASKIFEKAMCNRVYTFCEKFKLFDESQNGFRKKRSTSLAVFKYIQTALNIINNKQYAVGILIDLSKAYDRVQYNILLDKLYNMGIRDISHKWFASYLTNRKQLVELEYYNIERKEIIKVQSDAVDINASIPQGSVIGCLLFLIYINDLPKSIDDPSVLFADDMSILTSCTNNQELNENLHTILNNIINWLEEHNLQINFKKTKLIPFYPSQKKPIDINFQFNDIKLDSINNFSLLGLNIDTNINWKKHIEKLNSKLSKFVYAFREIKRSTDQKTALVTYYAYAYAWLSYGIILWGNSTNVSSVFTLQKRLIRILANIKPTDSCKPYFGELNILTLTCMYILETCKFVRKHPEFYKTRQEKMQTNRNLRPRKGLAQLSSNLKLHSSGPLSMSIKIYNNLPEYILNETKENKFTKSLKQLLITKRYYNINEFLNDKQ